jgi:hypothetical protein
MMTQTTAPSPIQRRTALTLLAGLAGVVGVSAGCGNLPSAPAGPSSPAIDALRRDAAALRALARHTTGREFLDATARLTPRGERRVFEKTGDRRAAPISPAAHAALPVAEQAGWAPKVYDEGFYWSTFYGSPLAYVRAFDSAGQHGLASLRGQRVLDIGYGAIGAPTLAALAGADVTGLEVDPLLRVLYDQPQDQGRLPQAQGAGRLRLLHGVFGGDPATTAAVGGGHTLIVSKNTFKRGFLKPENGRPPLVDFGVPEATLLGLLRQALTPGGLMVIDNLGGVFDPQRPATDIRSPFDADTLRRAGLEVLAFEVDDSAHARAVGGALGWAAQMGDLEKTLFARVTVLRRAQ